MLHEPNGIMTSVCLRPKAAVSEPISGDQAVIHIMRRALELTSLSFMTALRQIAKIRLWHAW